MSHLFAPGARTRKVSGHDIVAVTDEIRFDSKLVPENPLYRVWPGVDRGATCSTNTREGLADIVLASCGMDVMFLDGLARSLGFFSRPECAKRLSATRGRRWA